MAAPLYARYVPPKSKIQSEARSTSPAPKRKRERKDEDSPKSSKKQRNEGLDQGISEDPSANASTYQEELAAIGDIKLKATQHQHQHQPAVQTDAQDANGSLEHRKKKKRRKDTDAEEVDQDNGEIPPTKHSKILSKFENSAKKSRRRQEQAEPEASELQESEIPELHDLVPIPVPEAPAQAVPPSAFSTLPQWLSRPMSVPAYTQIPFEDLKVDHELLAKLRQKGFNTALPVQAGILPLLLPVPTQHPGDLCVSAATGSGKTLGYVLPVVQSLARHKTTSLRALIVVPTRELVEQVRETVEMCAAGTRLQAGTAVGSQYLESEQITLVEKSRRYDPVAYKQLRANLERKLSYDDEDYEIYDEDELELAEELSQLLPYHVPNYTSKVDILIATPGRLVEHIKTTPGFTLANLEWLVIDEADRLLDASFQEWVETLTAAIKLPRKVVLSATMTRDLDKLNGLRLRNPMMVVAAVDGIQEDPGNSRNFNKTEAEGGMEIPPTLEEFASPVGPGSEKPLYLQLLLSQILESGIPNSRQIPADDSFEPVTTGSASPSSLVDSFPSSRSPTPAIMSTANALVFTSTNESAHRLSHLLTHLLPGHNLSTLTKSSTSRSTLKALSSFRASKTRILIATDRASRGLDLVNLGNVINYDIPHSITSYVHRVGRTARAGNHGRAWTLVEDREAAWFWKEVAKGEGINRAGRTITRKHMDLKDLGPRSAENYRAALAGLEKDVKGQVKD